MIFGVAVGGVVFAIIACGYGAAKVFRLPETGLAWLSIFIVWFALPLEWLFLILDPLLYVSTIFVKPKRWK